MTVSPLLPVSEPSDLAHSSGNAAPPLARWRTLLEPGSGTGTWPQRCGVLLAVALVYFLTARLGLLLATPGGHVTPVWPPTGIALAALLCLGWRVWPGLWLGSFAANLWGFLSAPQPHWFASLATAAAIGVGAALTALLGGFLLRRYVGPGSPLERVRNVCAFMALGGVISCLFSATNGVFALGLGGFMPWTASSETWLTWWLGCRAGRLEALARSYRLLCAPGRDGLPGVRSG